VPSLSIFSWIGGFCARGGDVEIDVMAADKKRRKPEGFRLLSLHFLLIPISKRYIVIRVEGRLLIPRLLLALPPAATLPAAATFPFT
jgi:hypothetical protein